MKTLLFLESGSQFAEFARRHSGSGGAEVCALTPFAIQFCETNGIPHFRAPSCYSQEEYEEGKRRSERSLEALRAHLNRFGSAVGRRLIGFPLALGDYFTGLSLPTLGCLHHRAFILSKVIEAKRPDRIVAFKASSRPAPYLNLLFGPNEGVYASLLENSRYSGQCSFLTAPEPPQPSRPWAAIRSFLRGLGPIHAVHELRKHGAGAGAVARHFLPGLSSGRRRALFVGPLYDFGPVVTSPRFSGFQLRFFWGEEVSKDDRLDAGLSPFAEPWADSHGGIDVAAVFRPRLNRMLNTALVCVRSYEGVKGLVDSSDVLLSSCFLFPLQQMAGHLARTRGKKVVVWTHGAKGTTDSVLSDESNDLLYTDLLMTYGDGATEYYRRAFPGYASTTIQSVGSSRMRKAVGPAAEPGPQGPILYATGKYSLNMGDFNYVTETDELLFDAQKAFLGYLKRQQHAPALWKLNPTVLMGDIPFDAKPIRVVQFERSFLELVREARIVLLDSPSTAAIEAAASSKPLFVLLSRLRYAPEALALLRRRAVVRESPEELIAAIEDYFLHGAYPADPADRAFARAYGTHDGASSCEERAVALISGALGDTPCSSNRSPICAR